MVGVFSYYFRSVSGSSLQRRAGFHSPDEVGPLVLFGLRQSHLLFPEGDGLHEAHRDSQPKDKQMKFCQTCVKYVFLLFLSFSICASN